MKRIILISLVLAAIVAANIDFHPAATDPYGFPMQSQSGMGNVLGITSYGMKEHVISCFLSALMGGLLGAFLSDRFRKLRWLLFAIAGIFFFAGLFITPVAGQTTSFITAFIFAISALSDKKKRNLLNKLKRFTRFEQTTFGSSKWATFDHVKEHNLLGNEGLFLGVFRYRNEKGRIISKPLFYNNDRHIMTVAATRAGKGVSSVIPNLLMYEGSVLAIDIKGELSMTTALRRGSGDQMRGITGLGQKVYIVDPWGTVKGHKSACFNPMDWLKADDKELADNTMLLWDSIIVPNATKEPYWDEEAKSIGVGITLFVALEEKNPARRNLVRVREIITMGRDDFNAIMIDMLACENAIVRSTAMRTASKDPKLLSNVMSTLQAHTHFLESEFMKESLSRSDFCFEDLKTQKMTIYLVLPADRLDSFNRWLRMMIQQAITVNARNIEQKPAQPVLFMLDEVAALGRMNVLPRAYGLMSGYGMTLWSVVQNLSQLEEIYGKGWETFIGNSGVLQYYGSRDWKSAEYFSKLAGVTSIVKWSWSQSVGRSLGLSKTHGHSSGSSSTMSSQGGSSTFSHSSNYSETESLSDSVGDNETRDIVQRPLITPDELMVMRRDEALVLVENLNPIKALKIKWFQDETLKTYGVNLENKAEQPTQN